LCAAHPPEWASVPCRPRGFEELGSGAIPAEYEQKPKVPKTGRRQPPHFVPLWCWRATASCVDPRQRTLAPSGVVDGSLAKGFAGGRGRDVGTLERSPHCPAGDRHSSPPGGTARVARGAAARARRLVHPGGRAGDLPRQERFLTARPPPSRRQSRRRCGHRPRAPTVAVGGRPRGEAPRGVRVSAPRTLGLPCVPQRTRQRATRPEPPTGASVPRGASPRGLPHPTPNEKRRREPKPATPFSRLREESDQRPRSMSSCWISMYCATASRICAMFWLFSCAY